MEDLLRHTSKVAKDCQNIEAQDNLLKRINSVPVEDIHQFGILYKILENVDFSDQTVNFNDLGKHDILLFGEHIVAL